MPGHLFVISKLYSLVSYRGPYIAICVVSCETVLITAIILLHEKFLQFDWLRAVVFQLNLKYLHVKITNLLRALV